MIYTNDLRSDLKTELKHQQLYKKEQKDIIIVVHNAYAHIKRCLNSLSKYTKDYNLFLWDNASSENTSELLNSYDYNTIVRSKTNLGFIKPNNYLCKIGKSPYVILLNSDTVLSPGWDEALIGYLQAESNCGIVGYQGGILDQNYIGYRFDYGSNIDYVCGWGLCFRRNMLNETYLFDEDLKFAYGEDSDFSLRVKELGYKIYALHLNYVKHVGCATIKSVMKKNNVLSSFHHNHEILKKKWLKENQDADFAQKPMKK